MSFLAAAAQANEAIVGQPLTAREWIVAGVVAVTGLGLARVVRGLMSRAAGGDDDDQPAAAEAVGRTVGLALAAISLVYALGVLGVRLGPLIGALGIGGLALAFAGQTSSPTSWPASSSSSAIPSGGATRSRWPAARARWTT